MSPAWHTLLVKYSSFVLNAAPLTLRTAPVRSHWIAGPCDGVVHIVLTTQVEELEVRWADRILMVDGAVAHRWGELTTHYERRGQPMPAIDGLMAATAEVHNLVLVSHDAVFQRLSERVSVYDPYLETL